VGEALRLVHFRLGSGRDFNLKGFPQDFQGTHGLRGHSAGSKPRRVDTARLWNPEDSRQRLGPVAICAVRKKPELVQGSCPLRA